MKSKREVKTSKCESECEDVAPDDSPCMLTVRTIQLRQSLQPNSDLDDGAYDYQEVRLPQSATIDDVVAELGLPGCGGFLAIRTRSYDDDDLYGNDDDSDDGDEKVPACWGLDSVHRSSNHDAVKDGDEKQSSGVAEKLSADGGILLQLGNFLSTYGLVDEATCKKIWLAPVFDDAAKQPNVFKKDLDALGFGSNILKYVKLNPEMLTLRAIQFRDGGAYDSREVYLPQSATIDDVIAKLGLQGCCGFFAIRPDNDYGDEKELSGVAEQLSADGGILLQPGNPLSTYGLVDGATSKEVWLAPVFDDAAKQPNVFKKDLDNLGFGANMLKYVTLNPEMLIVCAIQFRGSLQQNSGHDDDDDCAYDHQEVHLPQSATVDDVIAKLGLEGCCGFLAVRPRRDNDANDYDNDDEKQSSGVAEKLSADRGVLLQSGNLLSTYGLVDEATSKEVWLASVFDDAAKQPTVFKKDLDDLGFGACMLKYVKLNAEDKEIVAARHYFQGSLFPWLSSSTDESRGRSKAGSVVSLTLSMHDDFEASPKPILTARITKQGSKIDVACTNLAGDVQCCFDLMADDSVAQLEWKVCEKLQWPAVTFWHESEKVIASSKLSDFSVLTAQQNAKLDHVCGCYQYHATGCRPAGYSASGQSQSHIIVLEQGKASLRHHFKGDYKRAEELLQLTMRDASWTIQVGDDGERSVRISGRVSLSRFWVHEREGPEGTSLSSYECFALVEIPVEELERVQTNEQFTHTSTAGSGWTCGSEDYKCSFFLPMCLVEALREISCDGLSLRELLNKDGSQDYPHNKIESKGRRFGRSGVLKLSQAQFGLIKHFRTNLVGKNKVDVAELITLQQSAPAESQSKDNDSED